MKKFRITSDIEIYDEDGKYIETWHAGKIVEGYLDVELLLVPTEDDTMVLPGYYEQL